MVVSNRADMRHFVACTKGCPVIMGRKTLLSFPGGRPLKNRRNIVLTATRALLPRASTWCIALTRPWPPWPMSVAWVIGGGEVYRQFLPYCTEAEVTHNHCIHDVDTYFPDLDADPAWEIARRCGVATIAAGEGDEGLDYEFVTYRALRRKSSGVNGIIGLFDCMGRRLASPRLV